MSGAADKPSTTGVRLPSEAIEAGELTLRWRREPGSGGNGRGCQVAEVWLLREAGDAKGVV